MQQVVGLDAMFLSLDSKTTKGHAAGIAYFDSPGEGVDNLAFLRARVAERLDRLPVLRWRLRPVPLRIDHSYWVDGPVDLAEHITRVRVPRPGTQEQLQQVIDRLMLPALERDRPMWRMWVIEGLPDGGYAYLMKLSHGLVDGSTVWSVFDQLSDEPVEQLAPTPQRDEPRGGGAEMLARGLGGVLSRPVRGLRLQADALSWAVGRARREGVRLLPNSVARILPGELSRPATKLANKIAGDDDPTVASWLPTLVPPHTAFNGSVTERTTMHAVDFDLAELRVIGKLVGGTINDAVLAVTAGAARTYLAEHGGIPNRPLIATTPISWRTGDEPERWANQVFWLYLPIPTNLPDPLARLRATHDAASTAKANWDGVPGHLTRRMSLFWPSGLMAPAVQIWGRLPARLTPKAHNLALSNVKGPRVRPRFGGAEMSRYHIYGFLTPGCALLIAGQSLGDRIVFCITVCPDVLPDHAQLPGLLRQAHEELLALAQAAPAAGA